MPKQQSLKSFLVLAFKPVNNRNLIHEKIILKVNQNIQNEHVCEV